MVICNIVHDENVNYTSDSDTILINKYKNYPSINVITNITHIDTSVPTLFYGLNCAIEHLGNKVSRKSTKVSDNYYWSYTDSEIEFENWTKKFVAECVEKWFKITDNGIDVVFNKFNIEEFVGHLNKWPLIHCGAFEIYIADWRDGDIIIHSVKKDTLEYIGIQPESFLNEMYEQLDYKFLSIDSQSYDLINNKNLPIFLDDILFANCDEWVGIDELIDYFSFIDINRKKVITYYLKQSEFLRDKFNLYLT